MRLNIALLYMRTSTCVVEFKALGAFAHKSPPTRQWLAIFADNQTNRAPGSLSYPSARFYCVASHVKGLRFLQFGVKQIPSSSYLGALGNLSGAGSPSLTSPATGSTWSAMPESGAAALLFPHSPPIAGFNSHAKLALIKNPARNNCLLSHKSLSLFSSPYSLIALKK